MNLNRILKVILAFCVYSPLIATDQLYIGLNTGKTNTHIDLERNFISLLTDSSNMGQNTIHTGTFIGYNHLITETPLFVGLEFSIANHSLHSLKGENTFPAFVNYETHIKTNNSYGGVIRLGIVIKDILIYGKGGIMMTNWTTSFVDKSDRTINNMVSQKYNKMGTTLGFGMDYNLTPQWAIGIDHTIISYSPLFLTHKIGTFKFSPLLSMTNLRLIYKF